MIAAGLDRPSDAAEAALHAAWAFDDIGPPGQADAMAARQQAVRLWPVPESAEASLRLVDVMRRAGDFTAAADLLDHVEPKGEDVGAIAAFQRARIDARDTARYEISSALRPPARRPHVTHGRESKPGFWRRVLGR